MSDPQITPEEEQVIQGVILKNPKIRGIVAGAGALISVGISATIVAYGAVAHVMPPWLVATNAVFTAVVAPAFGIWKANIK